MTDDKAKFDETMKFIKTSFGVVVIPRSMIAQSLAVSASAEATLFLSDKKHLYCLIRSLKRQTLGDVRKIAAHMGLKVESYLPPHGRANYFDTIGSSEFAKVFPGRKVISARDIDYYKSLAPYNPALLVVSEIKDGVIHQFDRDARTGWRPALKFVYRRIKTS